MWTDQICLLQGTNCHFQPPNSTPSINGVVFSQFTEPAQVTFERVDRRNAGLHRDTDLAQHCRRVSWATIGPLHAQNTNLHTFVRIKNGLRSSLDRKTS